MTTFIDSNQKRLREQAARIRLSWAHSGHPTTNIAMHSALRSLGVPHASRPKTVAEFRTWRDVEKEKIEAREANRTRTFTLVKTICGYLWDEKELANWNATV